MTLAMVVVHIICMIEHIRKTPKRLALLAIVALVSFTEMARCQPSPPTDLVTLNPGITVQPQNRTVNAGQNATFTVTAAGDAPLNYRWTFDGANVGSSSSYVRSNCQPADDSDSCLTDAFGKLPGGFNALFGGFTGPDNCQHDARLR